MKIEHAFLLGFVVFVLTSCGWHIGGRITPLLEESMNPITEALQ